MSQYPEHDKLSIFTGEQMSAIMTYVGYIESKGIDLVELKYRERDGQAIPTPTKIDPTNLFYKMIGVDKQKLEQERNQILKYEKAKQKRRYPFDY